MSELVTGVLFVSALLASLFMAWTIGAGSAGSTPFAPAVGAGAISVLRAGFIVGILILLGAVFQGASVSEAVGTELVHGASLSTTAVAVALLIAASLVTVGIFTGYPIATAFTVTGAVIGVGLALGGTPNWEKYIEIGGLWLLTPVIGGGMAYVVAWFLVSSSFSLDRSVSTLGAVVGAVVANLEFAFLAAIADGETFSIAVGALLPGRVVIGGIVTTAIFAIAAAGVVSQQMRQNQVRAQQRFTIVMGGIVAFSAGGSQVGLAVGPLVPLLEGIVPMLAILFGGGIGILIGAWTGAPRLIWALSQDYATLGPSRALAALIPAFVIAQLAILFGIPVSFNQIIVSAVFGTGLVAGGGGGGTSRKKLLYTFIAWTASFIGALFLGYGGLVAVSAVV